MGKASSNKIRGTKGKVRCAIYTRKSSEEGLEQDFNSLDAQREACEAFIKSQKHEGWIALPELYDDGGVSGATMERPALKRLLADIEANKIDAVVTYKVDRLTRSLSDFAKIVEVFDTHDVSFVSVTQQFNTTTSMGRLTLNVLLSFAQFEREVTGERIRDKIAASKKKGMWMGGVVPLGYDSVDRKLIVNEPEAETVRHIFRRYAELGSVRILKEALDAEGIVSKARVFRTGRKAGGMPLARGALYLMLQNRIYLGEIVHKDKSYPGEHDAIVDRGLWDKVQVLLTENRVERRSGGAAKSPSLVAGLLYDHLGERMTPSHSVKNGKRYRYYVSQRLITQSRDSAPNGRRIPAGDIEQIVSDRLRAFLLSEPEVFEAIQSHVEEAAEQKRLIEQAAAVSRKWSDHPPAQIYKLLRTLVSRIDLHPEKIAIHLRPARISAALAGDPAASAPTLETARSIKPLILCVPACLKRAGLQTKMLIDGVSSRKGKPDPSLIKLIVKAQAIREKLIQGGDTLGAIAADATLSSSYFTRLVRLSFLAPDLTKAIVEGRHPPELTARRLMRDTREIPVLWEDQRKALGFA